MFLAAFAVILALSTGLSFVGYRVLTIASEYRDANFVQFSQVQRALDLLAKQKIPLPEDARAVARAMWMVRAEAVWCVDRLSDTERRLLIWHGAERVFESCRLTLWKANSALGLLNRLVDRDRVPQTSLDTPFAARLSLIALIERMKGHLRTMDPQLDVIEDSLLRSVRLATGVVSLLLAAVFALASVQLVRAFRAEQAQTMAIRRLSRRFSSAMDATEDGFAIFDSDARLIECNARYRELSHVDPDAVKPGMTIDEIYRSARLAGHYEDTDIAPMPTVFKQSFGPVEPGALVERQVALSGDRHVLVRVNKTSFGDVVVARTETTASVRAERTQRQHAEALQRAKDDIERQSLTDPLTGLANRRRLDRDLAERMRAGPTTLIRIDLDRFKMVNDILGHAAGDFVLQHVAGLLQAAAQPGDLPARVGGDEFVILCAPETTLAAAQRQAEALLSDVLKPVSFGSKRCLFGASFGVAEAYPEEMEPSGLLNAADAALYKAKRAGRGSVEVFTPEMRQEAIRERALADRFSDALAAGEIVPYFQTQHRAADWSVAGAEVLARWEHPTDGVLAPPEFLGIARQLGMEAELDAAIFDAALKAVARLDAAGLVLPRVAFNVSAARIMAPDFASIVRDAIAADRGRYAFEILETISAESEGEGLIFAIDALKDMGFQVDVDDFGSEHASINTVMTLEPDLIKIDRHITGPLGQSDRAARMVASIVEMARALDVQVVAEGVDSADKASLLQDVGCDLLQGFFFSRPMTAAALHAALADGSLHRSRA